MNRKRFDIDYRPCTVDGVKALFHRWSKKSNLVLQAKNPMSWDDFDRETKEAQRTGNVPSFLYSKVITNLTAVVEFEDGSIKHVDPESVRFTDGIIGNFDFTERESDE